MKPLVILALAALPFSACGGDETARAYGAADKVWTLSELDGETFPATATLTFQQTGRIEGAGPCNRYTARMTAPYPWFEAKAIATTRSICAEFEAETAYLAALGTVTLAEVAGNTLILSTPDDLTMIFTAGD